NAGVVDHQTDILHLDMDSFFASVEILADPSLQGRPVVVGGTGPRGVVASASYAARTYGVRSAMPVGEARRLCPGLIVIAPRHDEYSRTSEKLMDLCRKVTPIVEPVSLDEAYLDVKGAHQLFGTSEQIGWLLRSRVRDELDLNCAIGVGRTKLIAKLASKAAKPHPRPDAVDDGEGVVVVMPDEEVAFLQGHRVRAIPGVGPKTAERLKRAGVSTVRDLGLLGRDQLISMFGAAHGGALFELAWGLDDREVVSDRELRSVGNEVTFDVDDYDRSSLASKARELAVGVASSCREREVEARTVSIKVRFSDFETIVRSRTQRWPLGDANEIAAVATSLLDSIDVDRGVRLIGVSVSNLTAKAPHAVQLGLFAASDEEPEDHGQASDGREGAAEVAADEIRRKFGHQAITSVAAAERRAARERRRGGDQR
ncbi:MAG TPA: DNA polymerase IV, partial [Acidimicrobiales bacterium]|nr:DNA polymerase IV [Acidimicrobiales bacterium]